MFAIAHGALVWYLNFSGVTHEEIYESVAEESTNVQNVVYDISAKPLSRAFVNSLPPACRSPETLR